MLSYLCVRSTRSTRSLGRFTGSTIDLDPLQSMISEIKGEETREQELTHCQPRFAEGNVRLQAAFEKLKGKEKGGSEKEKKTRSLGLSRRVRLERETRAAAWIACDWFRSPSKENLRVKPPAPKGHGAVAAGQGCS